MTEDEMVGWHHRCDGHEFEQAPGVGDGQGSLVCCSSCIDAKLFQSCPTLCDPHWTAALQASVSITNSRSLLKLMSRKSVMPSNHLILSNPSPPAFNLAQHQGLFQ